MSQFLSPPPPPLHRSPPAPSPPWFLFSPPPPRYFYSPRNGSSPRDSISTTSMAIILIVIFLVLPVGSILLFFFIRSCKRNTPQSNPTEPTTNAAASVAIVTEAQAQRDRRGGLDLSTVQTFPVLLNLDVRKLKEAKGQTECVICMSEFEDDEVLRMLPGCCHVFHLDCIGIWLASRVTCPVCRISLKDFDVEHVSN